MRTRGRVKPCTGGRRTHSQPANQIRSYHSCFASKRLPKEDRQIAATIRVSHRRCLQKEHPRSQLPLGFCFGMLYLYKVRCVFRSVCCIYTKYAAFFGRYVVSIQSTLRFSVGMLYLYKVRCVFCSVVCIYTKYVFPSFEPWQRPKRELRLASRLGSCDRARLARWPISHA